MPSVEDGGYYGEPLYLPHTEKDELIVPLGDTLSEEDMIIVAGLQARIDELKSELESQGHDLNCLTSDYFLHLPENDDDPNAVG